MGLLFLSAHELSWVTQFPCLLMSNRLIKMKDRFLDKDIDFVVKIVLRLSSVLVLKECNRTQSSNELGDV